MTDLVSIVIPAYNAARYIRRSLQSALDQSWSNIEILVVDDGSTDSTAEIIKSYNDTRIRYIYQTNQGQGAARNNGIENSRGQYVTLLDADDCYLPEKVQMQADFLRRNSRYGVVYCNALHFYSDKPHVLLRKKNVCPSGDILPQLLQSSFINPNTVMFTKDILRQGFRFPVGVKGRYAEEWELFLNLARAGCLFGYINEDLVIVEIRIDSNTQWDTQWVIRENSFEMLERVTAAMSDAEKEKYRVSDILAKNRFKLAVAYLIAGRKGESCRMIAQLSDRLGYVAAKAICLAPHKLLRPLLIKFWLARQKNSFVRAV
jgi:glycosyltransferase involved in cell wall biosynthesis